MVRRATLHVHAAINRLCLPAAVVEFVDAERVLTGLEYKGPGQCASAKIGPGQYGLVQNGPGRNGLNYNPDKMISSKYFFRLNYR
ncbi:hypothetical protein ANAPC5_01391 [Anaplasma phagocytophilum]|nr:hypothetical protein ANAPC5_01391 [Anaplasma phagocytophilum]